MTELERDIWAEADHEIHRTLESAISSAIEKAANAASSHPHVHYLTGQRADNHFAVVALHRLFLIACGADLETNGGGDLDKASMILHVGQTIVRGWQRENGSFEGMRMQGGSPPSVEDRRNREELRHSAELLVYGTVIRALVEHASNGDAEFRRRVASAIEGRMPEDRSGTEQAQIFAELVRSLGERLLGKAS
jgi:hypothetical protein